MTKLYKKMIKPIIQSPMQPPIPYIDQWFNENEMQRLIDEFSTKNDNSMVRLIFQEKYELFTVITD